jgi:hypothetical protein
MSFIGRGSYFAAAVAGVASAFYIFEPEFIELKRQREAQANASNASAAPNAVISSATPNPHGATTPATPASAPSAVQGRWQEMLSRDGRTYWMNLDTGDGAPLLRACSLARAHCSLTNGSLFCGCGRLLHIFYYIISVLALSAAV